MPIETERKFLVANDRWQAAADGGTHLVDGLLAMGDWGKVRVRIAGDTANITVKGPRSGFSRQEFEYPIPVTDAVGMLDLCIGPLLEKTRHCVPFGGLVWEVDVYMGLLEGVILAEVELAHPDQDIEIPDWIGPEVSGDPQFRKINLVAAALARMPQDHGM